MTLPVAYPWAELSQIDRATSWCEGFSAPAVLSKPTAQGFLLMLRSVVEQGHALFEQHWDSDHPVPADGVTESFHQMSRQLFSCLLVGLAVERRDMADPAVAPPPSLQLSVAHLANQLQSEQGHAALPQDVLSALAVVEALRASVLIEAFGPGVSPRPLPTKALEQAVVATGRLVAALEANLPWAHLLQAPESPAAAPTPEKARSLHP